MSIYGAPMMERMAGSGQPPQIGAIDSLNGATDRLHELVKALEVKLQPVLVQRQEKVNGVPSANQQMTIIRDRTASIEQAAHDLRDILERIDL